MKAKPNNNTGVRQCSYCGSRSPLIWVHGHGQCANCGINVVECCQGEQCGKATVDKSTET